MASRGSLNVLEPIPLNQLHDAHPPTKKRKISSTFHKSAGKNIIIRAHAASLSDEPYIFEPVAVIPRVQLPFDWLDAPSALSQIQSGSLFEANIPALEADSQAEPVILVVRLASDGGLYVVERVKKGIYALMKLSPSVDEGHVRVVVKASDHRVNNELGECTPQEYVDNASGVEWWRQIQVEDPAPDLSVGIPAKRAKVDFIFGVSDNGGREDEQTKRMSPIDSMDRSSSCDVHTLSVPPESQDRVGPSISGEVGERNAQETRQSPQELLDGLREQYLHALYISKASVAYFAKGPLARCRAAFQCAEAGAGAVLGLTTFYRDAILTAKKMDLKFRETLPATLRDIVLSVSDDDTAPKKRKSRKKTLGRNGLYPEEPEAIRWWWKNRSLAESGGPAETSRDAEIKKHVADLRLRETQLQILLILETMALEVASAGDVKKTGQEEDTQATPQKPQPKTKKPQDLNTVLELHLDRLCIWHAVGFDNAPSESQAPASSQQLGKTGGSDAMRDFCTEVIIPFYASRLPDRCKSMTRKLGVSASATSPFPKSAKKSSRKDSGVEHNPSQRQSRRTLQRVLSDEQTALKGRSKPSLNRSTTAPSQIESKRDTTPLLPPPSTSVRGGIQKAKRAENREVDLIAVARQHESKLRRVQMLADQKKELDAAILTLRRPNRELVAKDIAQDVEKRLTTSSSRKPKNPIRNPLGQGVQVMATPSKTRKRDAVAGLPLPKSVVRSKQKATSLSSSSPFNAEPQVIPGSVVRPSSFSGATFTADVAVQETPSRRAPQPSVSFHDSAERKVSESPIPRTGNLFRVPQPPAPRSTETDPSTPVRSQAAAIADTRLDPPTRLPRPPPLFGLPGKSTRSDQSSMVFETPPRPKPTPTATPSAGARRATGSKPSKAAPAALVTPDKSIYAALGWDDDDELAI